MTYNYINPSTKEPTVVPAKHYENILGQAVEQFLDEALKIEILNNIYKQVKMLYDEYHKDMIKSLLCIDLGIKPNDLTIPDTIAMNGTYDYILQMKNQKKKKFHLLDNEILEKYESLKNDKELHAKIIKLSNEDEETELDLNIENTNKLN